MSGHGRGDLAQRPRRATAAAGPPPTGGIRSVRVTDAQLSGFLLLTALLSVIIPWVAVTGHAEMKLVPLVMGLGLAAYAGAKLAHIIAVGRPVVCGALFWLFVYLWGALAPLVQMTAGAFPWPGMYSGADETFALAITWLGILSYDLGRRFARRQKVRNHVRILARLRARELARGA